MKKLLIPRQPSNGDAIASLPSSAHARRATRRRFGVNGVPNHRTPLERADVSVSRLIDDLVDQEEEVEAAIGPELLDPGFDAPEDLGSFVRLSTVTNALCGTWATWVSDDGD